MEVSGVLKINVNKDKNQSIIECEGAGDGLLVELTMAVNSVYTAIRSNDPDIAADFKYLFIALASDLDSPMWQCKAKMDDGSYCIVMPVPGKDE